MIVEGILNVFFGLVNLLLGFLPDISWSVNKDSFSAFFQILQVVCYFFPMGTVAAILGIIISINLFKVNISLVRAVLRFIPFL